MATDEFSSLTIPRAFIIVSHVRVKYLTLLIHKHVALIVSSPNPIYTMV